MADTLHRVGIKSSPDTVYEVLSDQKGLAGWWTKDTKASPTIGAINSGSAIAVSTA